MVLRAESQRDEPCVTLEAARRTTTQHFSPTSSAKSRAVHDSQRVLDQSSASTLTSGIIPISHTRGYRGRSRCGERRTTD